MIKNFKISLGTKVFLLTSFLLLFCSLAVCLLISVFTPQTYSAYLTDSLNDKVFDFLAKVKTIPYGESGSLFEIFLWNPEVISITLLDETGKEVPLPGEMDTESSTSTWDAASITMTAVASDSPEHCTMQSYRISFSDRQNYTLLVYGNSEPVYQLQKTFRALFPFLLLAIILASVFFSFFYSRIVTGLQKDIEKEKQLERARLEFFSAASHELKTPVTIIKGQLEGMLFNVGVYKNHEKYLARCLEVANTLEGMIQELLISSHLDTPDYCIFPKPVCLSEITKKRLTLAEDLLVGRELTVHTNMESSLLVNGDKALLEKAIGNLISNAAFYSPKGNAVFITVKSTGSNVLFQIENTGIHIPDDVLPRIFEPFYRGEQSRSRQTGGSGLGLSIVQKILKLHESICTAQNTPEGVAFSFLLPCLNNTKNTNKPH